MVLLPTLTVPGLSRAISGKSLQISYSVILAVHSTILLVMVSGAGPPFSQLYLIPKSSLMPPGLWEAEQMKPPKGTPPLPLARITADVAGVERRPFCPHHTVPTPAANA